MAHLLANTQFAIDTETWKFFPVTGKALLPEVMVPFYLWGHGAAHNVSVSNIEYKDKKGEYIRDKLTYRKCYTIELNGLKVRFLNADYKTCLVMFKDNGKPVNIDLLISPVTRDSTIGRFKMGNLLGAKYRVTINNHVVYHESTYTSTNVPEGSSFKRVWTLGNKDIPEYIDSYPQYGVSKNQFTVHYKNRVLGQCYAMLCGTWAVLLDDDLSIDSVCALEGVGYDALYVDKFFYSVNTYVVKMMTLLK